MLAAVFEDRIRLRADLPIILCFRMEYDCFQIELSKNYGINEWKDDLRKVMMKAGIEGQPVVFLFSDTQVM